MDRILNRSLSNISISEHFNILYVKGKFPDADTALSTRLGKLVSRRRQLIAARSARDRHLLTEDREEEKPGEKQSELTPDIQSIPRDRPPIPNVVTVTQSQVSGSLKTRMTRATVLQQPLANDNGALEAALAPQSEYTPSRASSYGAKLRAEFPDRPRGTNGEELDDFKCPYCSIVCHIETQNRWKIHILRDLQPYVCTFQDCSMYEHMFERRDEWFQHETQYHRLEWHCGQKGHERYKEHNSFLAHMQTYHDAFVDSPQTDIFLSMFERPRETASGTCSLCLEEVEEIKTHLAHHLEEVALFALPRVQEIPDMDSGANAKGSRGSTSTSQSSLDSGSQGRSVLRQLCLHGSVEAVKSLLERGADVNDCEESHMSPLATAASAGAVKIMQTLLEAGARVNDTDEFFGNALESAATSGHDEAVKTLLKHGADLNIIGGRYGRPLHSAVANGHAQVLQALLDGGAEINATAYIMDGKYDLTALQLAARNNHCAIIRLLLERGADVELQVKNLGTALQAAIAANSEEAFTILLDAGARIDTLGGPGNKFENALQTAGYYGNPMITQRLLDAGADVNAQGGGYGNALQAACFMGHIETVQLLMNNGADINARGGIYGSALQAACYHGHADIIPVLIEAGADVNAQGRRLGNPLAAALFSGKIETIRFLLEKGANIEGRGREGTPLVVASMQGHTDAVQLLLERGANIEGRGREGTALVVASMQEDTDTVRLLLERGANIEGRGREGTALVVASMQGHTNTVRLLLERGADIEGWGSSGTALEMAIKRGHHDVQATLREYKAKPSSEAKT